MFDVTAGKYYSLNEIASIIWNRIENAATVEELCQDLMKSFDVSLEVCQKDVISLLSRLQDRQLVQVVE